MANSTTLFCSYIIQHSTIYGNYKNVISSLSRNPKSRDKNQVDVPILGIHSIRFAHFGMTTLIY